MKYIVLFLALFSLVSCSTTASKKEASVILQKNYSLVVERYDSLPRQVVIMTFPGATTKVAKEDQGLTGIYAEILDKGPKSMTHEEYQDKLFQWNADIHYSDTYRSVQVSIVAPKEHLNQAFDLALETLRNPKMDAKNIQRVLQDARAAMRANFANMRAVVLYYAFKDTFKFNPETFNGAGSVQTLNHIQYPTIVSEYEKVFDLSTAIFHASGPMSEVELAAVLNRNMTKYNFTEHKAVAFNGINADAYTQKNLRVRIINRSGATDNQVLWVYPENVPVDTKETPAIDLAFEILGGGLTGKLGKVLREERGLTYHVSTHYGKNLPVWYVYSFAGNQQIAPLLQGIQEVLGNFVKSSISADDVKNTQKELTTEYREGNELPLDTLKTKIYYSLYNLNYPNYLNYEKDLQSKNVNDVNEAVKKFVRFEGGTLYLMGDKKVLQPMIEKLGWTFDLQVVEESTI
jgi:predicted Zn-dependent peptidase